jgi:regulator of sirC expression with transglutaminase-like and TPR domain
MNVTMIPLIDQNSPHEHLEHLDRLRSALGGNGNDPDPAELALIMATRHYPSMRVEAYLARLDAMAAAAQARLGNSTSPLAVIGAINHVLFEEERFRGNTREYYNPANSFLNEVILRRAGIPITLGAIYLSVARRIGAPIVGVGLPMHFIVKYVREGDAEGDIYIDPFHRGLLLTVEDCKARIEKAFGGPIQFQDSYLNAVESRHVLYRILNNLKMVLLRSQDFHRAGIVVEQMLVIEPDHTEEVRDRGLLYFQERLWTRAADFLSRYLAENPEAMDADVVRGRIQEAYDNRARSN